MNRLIASAFLGCALLCTGVARADDDHDRDEHHERVERYYDRHTKDWHNWDDNERRYYDRYVQENHRENRDFKTLKRREQDQYFRWRHEHSDDH